MLSEQAVAARRAYMRKWARDHHDKVKEHQERYWAKVAADMAAESEKVSEQPGPQEKA